MKEYSIIWIQLSKESDIGKHLKTSNNFALPFFMDGADKKKFEESNLSSLSQFHLLRGVLVGYFDQPPIINTEEFKLKAKSILLDLQQYFDYDTLENLILNISAFIREENGDRASFEALLAGIEICPESSKIKFDCCIDLYNLLERDQYHDKNWGISKLNELLQEIEIDRINPEFISYINIFREWIEQN